MWCIITFRKFEGIVRNSSEISINLIVFFLISFTHYASLQYFLIIFLKYFSFNYLSYRQCLQTNHRPAQRYYIITMIRKKHASLEMYHFLSIFTLICAYKNFSKVYCIFNCSILEIHTNLSGPGALPHSVQNATCELGDVTISLNMWSICLTKFQWVLLKCLKRWSCTRFLSTWMCLDL